MKHYLKTLLLIVTTMSTLSAADIASTTQDMRAFVLPKGFISIRANLNQINSTLDILNVNEPATSSDIYSAIGDSSGLYFSLSYGLHQNISLFYNFEALTLDYAGEELKNRKNDFFARINFYDNPQNSFDNLSMDIGYVSNSSKDLNPQISNLSDDSYYMRLLLGSKLKASLFNIYAGFKYSSIDTTLFNNKANRNEKAFTIGMSNTIEFSNYIVDTNYEYIRLYDRGSGLGKENSNHIFNIHISRVMSDNFLVFVGTKIMLNQFNGLIPYLYNTQTEGSFDKKYHYLKLGFTYNFNLLK